MVKNLDLIEIEENYAYFSDLEKTRFSIKNFVSKLYLKNKFLCFLYFEPVYYKNNPDCDINVDLQIFNIIEQCKKTNKKILIIIDATSEAPSYEHNMKNHIDTISRKLNIELQNFIILCDAAHQNNLIKNAQSFFALWMKTEMEFPIDPKYHFVSLARIARPHRVATTVEILQRNLHDYGNLSCGSGFYDDENENDFSYLPNNLQTKFPIYIDSKIIGHSSLCATLFSNEHEKIRNAFVNIVLESSYDKDFNFYGKKSDFWTLPFYTEKSFKPFAWGQVPIFVTITNHDTFLRDFGFDLFDDIINHNYLKCDDPHKRIKLAIDELQKVCQQDIQYWVEWKQKNIKRFLKNQKLALKIQYEKLNMSVKNLQKVIDIF